MCNVYRRRFTSLLILLVVSAGAEIALAADKIDPRVQGLLDKHLRANPQYAPGDLLTRDLVEPIYNDLLSRGIKPSSDPERMYGGILRWDHPFVHLMRSPQGREFCKKLGDRPLKYDRLERLSRVDNGMNWLGEMIASEQGVELFDHLFSEEGLQKLELQFAEDPNGRDIRRPTGTIYTETELAAHLTKILKEQLDAKQAVAAKKSGAAGPSSPTKSAKKPSGA